MNGIFITNWIEAETEGHCYARKLAFIDEVLSDLNKYRIDYIMEHTSMDETET